MAADLQIEPIEIRGSSLSALEAEPLSTRPTHTDGICEPNAGFRKEQGAVAEVSVVIPTFNEAANVPLVASRVAEVLSDVSWEIIFVDDDSPDGTSAAAKALAQANPRIRCIRRVRRRGLAGACIEGILASSAAFVAIMDADLQHDETLLREMLQVLRAGHYNLVIGSRYLRATANDGLSPARVTASKVATGLTRYVLGVQVTDPMSGFFMLRRELVEGAAHRLSTEGFKILADVLASTRSNLRVQELPYTFRARRHGSSKLDSQVALDFIGLLINKASGNFFPVRFITFAAIGLTGLLVHLSVLKICLVLFALNFPVAQTLATLVAMTTNFFLNNMLTYRDRRLTGFATLKGLLLFMGICGVGAIGNIGAATWLYSNKPIWWLAGIFGSLVGVVWNFVISTALVWGR
jgi:dolichol-phosphate mannosyltransferase